MKTRSSVLLRQLIDHVVEIIHGLGERGLRIDEATAIEVGPDLGREKIDQELGL